MPSNAPAPVKEVHARSPEDTRAATKRRLDEAQKKALLSEKNKKVLRELAKR